jgi:hypothetical protein
MTASVDTSATDAPARGAGGPSGLQSRLFRQLTVIPTLLAMAWLLAGLPLLLLGHFTPVLMLALFVPLAAVLLVFGLRWISGPGHGLLGERGAEAASTPWWTIAGVVAVAVLFAVDQFAYHSQYVIVMRDPASYLQFGNWIARHGSLPIPQDAAAFGGYNHALSFNTAAFYQVGHTIVPQFMAGLPMTLAAAFWIGGVHAATATGAVLGGCGVLAMGGLVGRLVGPRWAPLGALALALSLPEQFTSRSTYSEPLAQILFLGGLCLVIDSFSPDGTGRRKIAALGGLAIGLTLLVRIDGASDMLPLIPYCGLLILGRGRQAWALFAGLAVGSAYGAIDGLVLSRPYLDEIRSSLLPLVLAGFLVLAVTAIVVRWRWSAGLPVLRTDRLPNAAAMLAFVITIGLVIRPYVQTVYTHRTGGQAATVRAWQVADHLPIQPGRQYYEISLHWVFWYLGVPVVALATIGAAVLARRCLRGAAPAWTLPLMCFGWIIVTTLLRPAIYADQPWGSRRLVPGVLPGFVVLAVWAVSWLTRWLRERGTRPEIRYPVVGILALALLLPAAKTTFGIAHQDGGPLGTRLVATGLADKVTYGGEIAAVQHLCAEIPADSSVLFLVRRTAGQFAQVVRGMCGDPAAVVVQPTTGRVRRLIADIQRAGRRPVLLSAYEGSFRKFGPGPPVQVVDLQTRADAHELVKPPLTTDPLTISVWMMEFAR